MTYTSVDIARYIIAVANKKGKSINMTKLQKLLYITYGIYLAVNDSRLFEEHPQAWPYGPVFPTTRNRLLSTDFYGITFSSSEFVALRSDQDINALIDLVFRSFGDWTASQLTEWSHRNGSPWERTVELEGFTWGNRIPDDFIKPYFKMIIGRDGGE